MPHFVVMFIVRLQVLVSLVAFHVALFGLAAGSPLHHQLQARQSSDGCGPNPLVTVIAYAREFGKYAFQVRNGVAPV